MRYHQRNTANTRRRGRAAHDLLRFWWLPFNPAVAVTGAICLVFSFTIPLDAQSPSFRSEEVRHNEPVGANQLALRAFLIDAGPDVFGKNIGLAFIVPTGLNIGDVRIDVRDALDKGYHLQVLGPCPSTGVCEYYWPDDKMISVGVNPGELWPVVTVHHATDETIFIPSCVCSKNTLKSSSGLTFVFIPSQTVNIKYSLYNDQGVSIEFCGAL